MSITWSTMSKRNESLSITIISFVGTAGRPRCFRLSRRKPATRGTPVGRRRFLRSSGAACSAARRATPLERARFAAGPFAPHSAVLVLRLGVGKCRRAATVASLPCARLISALGPPAL
jgi:hypothetical protein